MRLAQIHRHVQANYYNVYKRLPTSPLLSQSLTLALALVLALVDLTLGLKLDLLSRRHTLN